MAKRGKPTRKRSKHQKIPWGGAHRRDNTRTAGPPALRLAKTLFKKGEYQDSLRQFERAVRENPNDVRTLIDAARAFGARFQMSKCDALLQKALRLSSRRADIHYLVGESYRMFGENDKAALCFQKSCVLSDDIPAAQLELAAIYERQHKLQKAMELTNRVLKAQPRSASASMLQARLLRRTGKTSEAEKIFRRVAYEMRIPRMIAAEALGHLAQLLDEQGRYEDAWKTILKCKQIQLGNDAKERTAAAVITKRFGQLVDSLTRDQMQSWQHNHMVPHHNVALLAGFPRSGTTLLEQVLDSHPGLISSEEQDVFSSEIFPGLSTNTSHKDPLVPVFNALSNDEILQQRSLYLESMEARLGELVTDRVHLDKNPAMILMIPCAIRLFPEMKVLIALRDPRDVVVSCFLRYLPLNPISVTYLTLDRLSQRYALDMRAWLRWRDLLDNHWLEIRYEDIVQDLRQQARGALDFLGLPWQESVLEYRDRWRRNSVKSPSYEAVTKPIYSTAIGRWKNYENQLASVLPDLDQFVDEFGYR